MANYLVLHIADDVLPGEQPHFFTVHYSDAVFIAAS
jgi:hypothetical protein